MNILDVGAAKSKPPYLYILVVVLCGHAGTSSLTSRWLYSSFPPQSVPANREKRQTLVSGGGFLSFLSLIE